MNNLCLIMTGQIRSFFTEESIKSYTTMIELCKKHYSNILIIAIVNGEYNRLSEFLELLGVSVSIVDYNTYNDEYHKAVKLKSENNEYIRIKQKYQENKNNLALNEIYDPDSKPYHWVQFHQIYVGISQMLNYESLHNIRFDIIMRARFDMKYKPEFYPHLPVDPVKRIMFNDELLYELLSKCQELGIPPDTNSLLQYLKTQKIEPPNCRVNNTHLPIAFGGMYLYNTTSLENILNGSSDILYAFNDFIYFSKREVFLKLSNLFNDYGLKELEGVHHLYAQEAQLCIFCINNGINILMFTQLNPNGFGYVYGPT